MSSEFMNQVLQTVEAGLRMPPSALDFEMAYQNRVALDRIRFAIKAAEPFARHSGELRELTLQLMDALDRLESADRHFQSRFHFRSSLGIAGTVRTQDNGCSTALHPSPSPIETVKRAGDLKTAEKHQRGRT